MGAARDEDELSDEEKRIVNICRKTSIALQHELNVRKEIPHTDRQQILETFTNPVLGSIKEHYFKDLVPERLSAPKHLKLTSVHYARLYGHKTRLSKIVKRYLGQGHKTLSNSLLHRRCFSTNERYSCLFVY